MSTPAAGQLADAEELLADLPGFVRERLSASPHPVVLVDAAMPVPEPVLPDAVALMSLSASRLTAAATDRALGEACRRFPSGVFVALHDAECPCPEVSMQASTRLFAFGFRRIGRSVTSDRPRSWFAYRLKEYKPAPDWLNARFWANPERFHVHEDEG